jgi:SagB-type dehydrogenase family enzyme
VILAISADVGKTTTYYGKRGTRYVHMDIGHVGQNIYLISEALGLGTVAVGAFDDDRVARLLALPRDLFPFYLMPIGRTP